MAEKVIFHTLPEQIAIQLRRSILAGELRPGQPLREQDIADSFGVSRGPIREVFRLLAEQGLLAAEPNKGVRVAAQPSRSIRPLLVTLRVAIETFVLDAIFATVTKQDLAAWQAILADIKAACQQGDTAELVEHDLRFHGAIIQRHSDNELFAIWQPIALRMLMHYQRHGDLMESFHEHKRILDAIARGDKQEALAALAANIQ